MFKIGDFVIALPSSRGVYTITLPEVGPMEVTDVSGYMIWVKLGSYHYDVESRYFALYSKHHKLIINKKVTLV